MPDRRKVVVTGTRGGHAARARRRPRCTTAGRRATSASPRAPGPAASSMPRTTCRSRRPAVWTASPSSPWSPPARRWPTPAGTDVAPYDPMRIGCIDRHRDRRSIDTIETQLDVMRERGAKMVSPLGIPQYMPNAAAAAVTMKHKLRGQSYGVVSACASGAHAIGSALRMIQYGDADAVVCGGAEATLTDFGFACFNSMQALSPTGISRPFDARRDGFVMGEGAGHARPGGRGVRARRAAPPSSARWPATAPPPTRTTSPRPSRPAAPASRAIELAMRDAGADAVADRLHQRPRHLDPAQRRRRDGGDQARARGPRPSGSRSPRPSPRSATRWARPAPSRRWRRSARSSPG